MAKNSTPSQRQLKVGEELRHLLSETFMRGDIYDPATGNAINVTVSEARVSPDLRNATIFIMPFGGDREGNTETTLKILQNMAPQIRNMLYKKLHTRNFPTLHFKLDTSLDNADRINALLHTP